MSEINGGATEQDPNFMTRAMETMLQRSVAWRTGQLAGFVHDKTGGIVQHGPFAGMKLSMEITWGLGDIPAKLLGMYEQELHGPINWAMHRKPRVVFNVGCAEGYYAVGLARRLPDSIVVAIDVNPEACKVAERTAQANGVLVVTGQVFEPANLDFLGTGEHGLVVMDIEGAELEVLSPAMVERLKNCDVIVECHDFIDITIKSQLINRFKGTHEIEIITESARDPNIPPLDELCGLDRWLCVNENRPILMQWLACWSVDK